MPRHFDLNEISSKRMSENFIPGAGAVNAE